MKSNSEREATLFPIASGRPTLSLLSCAILLSISVASVPARAGVSLTEMGRIEAADAAKHDNTLSLFQGYLSLGLFPEAASLLERRVRMMIFSPPAAAPLFDVLVDAQSRFDSPERLIAVCKTAILSGGQTPQVLYFYGTGLRSVRGRIGEASAALAQVGPGSPYHLLALYSLGQIAAERRDVVAAEELFRRVEQGAGGPGWNGTLARRAARSRAELLLANGRGANAAPVFKALLRDGNEPLDRIGLASAGSDPVSALEMLPAEMTAKLPLRERIRFLLLFGGLARESGRYALAVDRLTLAGTELEEAVSTKSPPPSEARARSETLESLRLQIERLRSLLRGMESIESHPEETVRADALELLVGLILADRTISRAAAETPFPGFRFFTSSEIGEIVRRIEEVVLDGIDVDRIAEQLPAALNILRNLSPSMVYRNPDPHELNRIEGGDEIQILWEEFRQRRSVAVDGIVSARDKDASLLLKNLWLYIRDLGVIRSVSPEVWEITLRHFRMAGKRTEGSEEARDLFQRTIRKTVAYSGERLKELLLAVETLEKGEQAASWERRKPQLIALRAVVFRQLGDVLIAKARGLRQDPREEARMESISVLEQAVSFLSGDRLTPADAAEVAVQAGSLLAEGRGRWEPFPGRGVGEREMKMVARILPLLPADAPSRLQSEESLYLRAALRLAVKDPAAGSVAREFLEKYPASPLSAELGVRLGQEAFLAGDTGGAVARFRASAETGDPETSAVARYMLAWIRFQSGDVDGTVMELSHPLSAPSFSCGDLSPFEQEVLSLSVRAWRELPPEKLESYPSVTAGTCGGKVLLTALWEAEEIRGEASRAAKMRDIAARRFLSDEGAAALEMKMVGALLRAGQDREALARALTLRGKYGPGSAWAESQPSPVREKAAAGLDAMLKTLSERKFDEGIRSGDRSAMSSAATLMEEYFATGGGETSDEDGELRLKWVIALLMSGDREGGVLLLEELVGEQLGDATGERAGVLYAETMIAGFERNEATAEDAENAALLLLVEHPSEKAISLALRASSAFLGGGEYGRASRLAEEIEGSRFATSTILAQAHLIHAEAAFFAGEFAAARSNADLLLVDPSAASDPGTASRARDLYLLSSLKEAEGKVSEGDPEGAASMLEGLSLRFPASPEAPMYILRATRLHAESGNAEGAIRSGLRFLREYPRREAAEEAMALVGPLLEAREEFAEAGDLYEGVAGSFPKSGTAPRFLFHAARLAEVHGPTEAAERRFSVYRARYPAPAWMWTYATLSVGLAAWQRGDSKTSIPLMEEGLRKADAGQGDGSSEELAVLAAKARIAIGENWAEQFRMTRLVLPLEKSLAAKDRFFRQALGAFGKVEIEAPLEISLKASQLSGDLFVDYGKAVLASQRPKKLEGSDRKGYEEALIARARTFFERSVERYAAALERLEKEGGTPDLAMPIRTRLETAKALLESTLSMKGGKAE
jgi:TolA-binding protein